ncbi:MAG: hypothetical protein WD712_02900 [Candidatus Spechtbacterales bacterium]
MNKVLNNFRAANKESGIIALLVTVIVMSVGIVLVVSMIFVFLNRLEAARNIEMGAKAYFVAEAGAEDALLRELNPSIPTGITPYTLSVGDAIATIDKTTTLNSVTINSNGNASNRERTLRVVIGVDPAGTTFSFAAQIGERGLTMASNSGVNGQVYSNGDIIGASGTFIEGDAYAVGTISSPSPQVGGTRNEGADPIALPPFDEEGWAEEANINNDPIVGNLEISGKGNTLGPRRIEGNLTIKSGGDVTITGPVHITGNFVMNSNSDVYLDESFESDGTVVWAEGTIFFDSSTKLHGTNANPKGYLLFASTAPGTSAIELSSNATQEVTMYAVNGDVVINSKGDLTALIGNGIILRSNAEINFDLGLITYTFTTGGQGSYGIIKWEEL